MGVRGVARRWVFGPPTKAGKKAFAVFAEFRPDRFGLNVAYAAGDAGQEVEVVVGPLSVSLHGPAWPGADDDFDQMAAVEFVGHTASWYLTRTFAGFDAALAKTVGGVSFHGKAGPVGLVIDPVEAA